MSVFALPERNPASPSEIFTKLQTLGLPVDASSRRRMEYAYDASNYRVVPSAVVHPRTPDEVRQTLLACRDAKVPVTVRGGGTSMAGNAVGDGLIIDLSQFLDEIEAVDEVSESVWASAGAVLSSIRMEVERATNNRYTFAPDPSSHTRATLGGSIGNDACGNHSIAYGRVSHHVIEIEIVTADGAHLIASTGGLSAASPEDQYSQNRAVELEQSLRVLARENLALLRQELETIPRQVSGFHLGQLLPERGFNVARSLVGSEGTCAIVLRARVKIVPKPRSTALLCLGYESIVEAAEDIGVMLPAKPSAVEALDGSIVEIVKARRGTASVQSLPQGSAYVLVEFSVDDLREAEREAEQLAHALEVVGRLRGYSIVTDPTKRAELWRIREDGAGLSSQRLDGTRTWPGWEDSAVAPENLANYLSDLVPLVKRFGYSTAMYGHFGAGCVHMRLDFDFSTSEGKQQFESFVREAAMLVVAHGGSLSGEHGDGRARSSLLSTMYSARMLEVFREFKAIWDPQSLLNPGIIVDPVPFSESLALSPPRPTSNDEGVFGSLGNSHACIGVGRCRADHGSFMCPSYRATRDEKDSTRGRARVLQELTLTAASGRELLRSSEAREALDLCLSCKACSSDCPTGVDMATAKSESLQEQYRFRVRPLTHYSIGWLPRWLPLLGALAPLANRLSASRPLRQLAEMIGISAERSLPRFKSRGETKKRFKEADFSVEGDVIIFADSFTKAFRPDVIPAAARVLRQSGDSVSCESETCCGLTWISTGQRAGAAKRMERLVRKLDDGTDRRIVVLEPSCAAAMKDDMPKILRTAESERVASRIETFASAMNSALDRGWRPESPPPHAVVLQTHCHEHAVFGQRVQRRFLEKWGVSQISESSSCCGVAGNFGFESDHFEVSMKVAEHSIVPALEQGLPDATVLTDGYSCSMQVLQVAAERASSHLAVVVDKNSGGN